MPKQKQTKRAFILQERQVFARNFRRARKEAGLTQNDITKTTGLTQPYLSDVENAKSTINLDNANVLADAVGQPLWRLLTPDKK
jgi:transcriptional regulator with XRE-family HTH domain